MGKIVEFDNVYLEYPDELENVDNSKEKEQTTPEEEEEKAIQEYEDMLNGRTQRLSLEELQRKLEETQSLHL